MLLSIYVCNGLDDWTGPVRCLSLSSVICWIRSGTLVWKLISSQSCFSQMKRLMVEIELNSSFIQMFCYLDARQHCTGHLNSGPVIKWWSEDRSVNRMVIWISNYHGTGHQNSKPFNKQTNPHDLDTELVCYSDPHCIYKLTSYLSFKFNNWTFGKLFIGKQLTLFTLFVFEWFIVVSL